MLCAAILEHWLAQLGYLLELELGISLGLSIKELLLLSDKVLLYHLIGLGILDGPATRGELLVSRKYMGLILDLYL